MKKVLLVVAIGLCIQFWGDIKNVIDPAPDFSAQHDSKVVLYATSWCGYCAKTRELLKKNDIDYHEYDIEKSAEGNRQYEALGGQGVPLMQINGEVVRGYNPDRILEQARAI